MARCEAKTKDGKPCKAPATAGGLCFFHANPARAREFGRIGGRKNRQQLPETLAPTAMTAAELSRLLSEALRDVRSNKLGPRRAAAMSQLASVLNRTIQVSDVERRVSRLEERMVEGTPGVSSEVAPEGATEAAPVEVREEASGSNGSATVEEAEPTSDDDSRSGSNAPEPAKE
jgi:hypothetical protein